MRPPGGDRLGGVHPPVLHLQEVADQAVASTALYEVALCAEERLSGVTAMLLQEVIEQGEL